MACRASLRSQWSDVVRHTPGAPSGCTCQLHPPTAPAGSHILVLLLRLLWLLEAQKGRGCSAGSCAPMKSTRQTKSSVRRMSSTKHRKRKTTKVASADSAILYVRAGPSVGWAFGVRVPARWRARRCGSERKVVSQSSLVNSKAREPPKRTVFASLWWWRRPCDPCDACGTRRPARGEPLLLTTPVGHSDGW